MTSPVSLPSGAKLTAAKWDAYENLTGPWTAYTPTWAATGTAPSLGNGAITGAYIQVGKLFMVRGKLVLGTTSTLGTLIWTFSLPVTMDVAPDCVGTATFTDSGTNIFSGACRQFTTTTVACVSASGFVGPTVPYTWSAANADELAFAIIGEVA